MYPGSWMHPHPWFLFEPFGFGLWGLIVLAFWIAVIGVPIGRILRRIGWSPWLAILAFIPLVNLMCLWLVALGSWPVERRPRV
jgi:hypothetical protein